ncbi:hypothetical protein [Maribacter sp. UBA4516]|uniref:hypothetical protein n=1 Tax=Maribacter sp. UBA4516 TaxID=1946804 RepID=UPI002579AC4F|nr:hypothetical protein [Maribacter sp. UBA4516]|tara:strand:+ start:193 stop:666 length:474 start_codon:yes stop_codon:yes gene_type:complete
MSPAYLINVYRSANVLVKKDKYILKKYKIDSISSITTSDTQNRVAKTSSYLVFFNNKKEKLKISIINENSFSFSKRTKSIYKDFENNILKENGWMGRSRSDSIYIWKSTNSNIYGFKEEKELDVSSYQYKLIFNVALLIITIFSVRYLVKYNKKKRI